ncbi:hypothetical protein [Mesorhizobium sp. ANAO-SY3R2]|uniref:hypothetical protein n=1 Tax=Mesorhizobium sp. ANAO-SY3R2 TaxID=3166644 RepID=UPI00366E5AFB
MSERIPCINPRCNCTAARDKFPNSDEIICGKCFRALPEAVRQEHRRFWREIRKWDRRIARTSDDIKIDRMRAIRDRVSRHLSWHWVREIKTFFLAPEKPAGLDTFLEEMGL